MSFESSFHDRTRKIQRFNFANHSNILSEIINYVFKSYVMFQRLRRNVINVHHARWTFLWVTGVKRDFEIFCVHDFHEIFSTDVNEFFLLVVFLRTNFSFFEMESRNKGPLRGSEKMILFWSSSFFDVFNCGGLETDSMWKCACGQPTKLIGRAVNLRNWSGVRSIYRIDRVFHC